MTENNHCSLLININNENKLKCQIFVGNERIERNVKMFKEQEEYLPMTITFEMNEIIIGEQRETTIDFVQDWFNNPEEFKEYQINYQNKEYKVIAEVLFSLLILQYKEKIEKLYIIDDTTIQIQSTLNDVLFNKISTSLQSIGLKNISINPIEYDYESQGEILLEIIDKNSQYKKWKRILERGKKKLGKNNLKEKNLLTIDNTKIMNNEIFNNLTSQFPMKKRTQLKLSQLDNDCIFLASKWLDCIDDHINLIQVSKRLEFNMTKFYFNPISLTKETREFFPNIQTLIQYKSNDHLFEDDERIKIRKDLSEFEYLEDKKSLEDIDFLEDYQIGNLEYLIQRKCREVIFDSDVDDWSVESSVFEDRVVGKKDLVFIVEEEEYGSIFGYYHSPVIIDPETYWEEYSNFFEFNLNDERKYESKHNYSDLCLGGKSSKMLISMGDITLWKKEIKNLSDCEESIQRSKYDYGDGTSFSLKHVSHQLLCGKANYTIENYYFDNAVDISYNCFTPKRIVVVETSELKKVKQTK